MDQEKNLNEELTETAQDVVEAVAEEVAETAEEVAETAEEVVETADDVAEGVTDEVVETVEEKIRPMVYDDFTQEPETATEADEKPAKTIGFGALAISTVISSVVSVVVTLAVLFLMNAIPAVFTAAQIDGVWALDMTEYQMGYIYVVLDDDRMTLTSDTQGVMFSCDYDVTAKDKIELSGTSEEMMMVSNLISSTELKVKYDKATDALTFTPGIGGVATWNAVDKDQAKSIIEKINEPVSEPEFEDITGNVPSAEEIPEVPAE